LIKFFRYKKKVRSNFHPNLEIKKGKSDLEWLLWDMVDRSRIENIYLTRTGKQHIAMKSRNNHVRRNFPQPIIDFLEKKKE